MLRVQTADEALARDAAEYARQFGVAPEQAMLRLRAQEASVVDTDRCGLCIATASPVSRSSIAPTTGSSCC
jgi:hypothetical protein